MADSADKRSVSTDALETLGTIIGPHEKRDAIHIAVEPVEAAERLQPGEHVGLDADGKACTGPSIKYLGIVDPFLKAPVNAGEWFWLNVYPRQIRSLRHVWEHPDFSPSRDLEPRVITLLQPNEGDMALATEAVKKHEARQYLEWLADETDRSYDDLLELARSNIENDTFVTQYDSESWRDAFDHDKFWAAFTLVTGEEVPEDKRGYFFNCSC